MKTFVAMLGHGRALEMYLIALKFVLGLGMIVPSGKPQVVILHDLWWLADYWIGGPLIVVASIQLTGILLNIRGVDSSWVWRSWGAGFGVVVWGFVIFKSFAIGATNTSILGVAMVSIVASCFLLWKGMNRLPVPGAPGAI